MTFSSLYVSRVLLNGSDLVEHFAEHGFSSVVAPGNMHVTVLYSKQSMSWEDVLEDNEPLTIPPGQRSLEHLGPNKVIVMRFASDELQRRWREYRTAGGSSDYPSYLPHVTVSYDQELAVENIPPFPGNLYFGPEIRKPIVSDWKPDPKAEIQVADLMDKAIVAQVPMLVKARPSGGRRIVEVESSTEAPDYDGDVVLQQALVASADRFVATGHLDIDHLSEFGARLGIQNPASYIIGRPRAVKALDDGRTWVEGEISRSIDGRVDPVRNRYDEFWLSLMQDPPVIWFASIYGFPSDLADMASDPDYCSAKGATRWVIKSIDWRSLAFTRSPKNTALKGAARIITAKSYLAELAKGLPLDLPFAMGEVIAKARCPHCAVHQTPSLLGFRAHFSKCCGFPVEAANLYAHAVMYRQILISASRG